MHSDPMTIPQFTKQHPYLLETTVPFHREVYTLEVGILAIHTHLLEQLPRQAGEQF